MSRVAIIGGIVLVMCSSSVAAALMMGGEETTSTTQPTGPIGPAPPVDPFPKDIPGLSGRYTVASAESSKWKDISGKSNDGIVDRGSISKEGTSYVKGGSGDGLKFPAAVLDSNSNYTLFYVGRYNGQSKGRIFDGTDRNWLSTWWNARVGVGHHSTWMTPYESGVHNADAWVQGTDSVGIYRTNGVDRVTIPSNNQGPSQITINSGQFVATETTDWALKEVIIYSRKLTSEEILKVEKYLKDKYMSSGTENYRIRNDEVVSGFSF